jgi:hypothetical protein
VELQKNPAEQLDGAVMPVDAQTKPSGQNVGALLLLGQKLPVGHAIAVETDAPTGQ